MTRHVAIAGLVVAACVSAIAQNGWRAASERELAAAIPTRAPVVSERVETERTSMSGIVDKQGHAIAAAVLITAGYSAAGKYSDFMLTQVPIEVAGKHLPPGNYLLGWTRNSDGLAVQVFTAADGKPVVDVVAKIDPELKKVEQIRVWAPAPAGKIQLGRFAFPFSTANK